MGTRLPVLLAALCLTLLLAGGAPAEDKPPRKPTAEEIKTARKLVDQRLAQAKAKGADVFLVADEPVLQSFPEHLIFTVRFRQYPIAPSRPRNPSWRSRTCSRSPRTARSCI